MPKAFVITALLLSLALGSCGTFEVSLDRGSTATPGMTPITPPAASTQARVPTEPVGGTAIAAATQEAQPASRIEFAPEATQNVTRGTLQPGQTRTFVLAASKGQVLMASLDSLAQDVTLAISGSDGASLLDTGLNSFAGALPETQDYYIQVSGGAIASTFTINIVVAARILFAPGEKRSTLTGRTSDGLAVTYSAYALKGQKMHVILEVPGESAGLTIWGLSDGEAYARAQNGVRDFTLVLPAAQDYMIQVMPRAGQVVDYTLTVEID